MIKNLYLKGLLLLAILFILPPIVSAQDANKLLRKIDENLMPESYESYRKLINEEPDGKTKEFLFYTVKKGKDKVAMLYLEPASDRGKSTLRMDENMWLYIPNVGKPIRITSMQSVVGGVFNNSDIMRLDYGVEYNATILKETDKEYLLNLKAKNKTVAYDRLKMWALKDGLTLTKIECYSATNMLLKTLDFKKLKDFGNGLIRPSVIETYSPLYKGYRSLMIYITIKSRKFPDEVFTQNFMPRLEELR